MLSLIILAAGKGTRLNANKPKCLYKLNNKPLIDYLLDNFSALKPKQIIIVIGYKKELLIQHLQKRPENFIFVEQKKLLGTAHAVKLALKKIKPNIENILVTNSDDAFLYKNKTLKNFVNHFKKNNLNFSFLTTIKKHLPSVSAVIKKNKQNNIKAIEPPGKNDKNFEIVCGVYLFKKPWLKKHIKQISQNKKTKEYYLTNLIYIGLEQNEKSMYAYPIPANQWLGINTTTELKKAEKQINRRE